MSLSVERQDHHLTPDGWIDGRSIVDAPTGTVLTVSCYETPCAGQPSDYIDLVSWSCGDEVLIAKLKEMHGFMPPCFWDRR